MTDQDMIIAALVRQLGGKATITAHEIQNMRRGDMHLEVWRSARDSAIHYEIVEPVIDLTATVVFDPDAVAGSPLALEDRR